MPNLKLTRPFLLCHNWLQVAKNLQHVKSHGRDKSNDRNWHTKPPLRFPVDRRSVSHYPTQCIMRCRRSEAFPTYWGRTTVPGRPAKAMKFWAHCKSPRMEREERDRKGKEAGKAEKKDATWIPDGESLSTYEQFLAHHQFQVCLNMRAIFHSLRVNHKKTCIRPT